MQGSDDTRGMEFSLNRSMICTAGRRTMSFHNASGRGSDLMNKTSAIVSDRAHFFYSVRDCLVRWQFAEKSELSIGIIDSPATTGFFL